MLESPDLDVRALFNHDPTQLLGRTTAGTLTLGSDARGLWYEVTLPNTQLGNDLATLIQRGDVSQSSFAFTVDASGESWTKDSDGIPHRSIMAVSGLFDVSPVTYPAYTDTSVTVNSRCMEAVQAAAVQIDESLHDQARERRARTLQLLGEG